jgi:hypothetical protein
VAPNSRNNFAGWFLKSNAVSNSISLGPYTATKSGTVSRATVDDAGPLPSSLAPGQQVAVGVMFDVGASGFGGVGLTIGSAGCPTIVPVSHTVTLSSTAATGIPFGLFGIKPDSTLPCCAAWTGGSRTTKNVNSVLTQLAAARTKVPRLRMWYNITGGDEQVFANGPGGSFNLQRWKDTLDKYADALANGTSSHYDSLLTYIQDGTLQGIQMLDDLGNFSPRPSFSQIEAMAAHAKRRYPTLVTAVRDRATSLLTTSNGAPYASLDVAWAQFRSGVGTPSNFRNAEISAAQQAKLGLVLGVNITHGGYPLFSDTPVQIDTLLAWGNDLLRSGSSDYACGFIMWNIDYPSLSDSKMTTLANLAKNHVAAPCRRRP